MAVPILFGEEGEGLVLSQQDDGTDLIDFPREALPSLRNRWEVGWGEGGEAGREGGGGTGIGLLNKLIN